MKRILIFLFSFLVFVSAQALDIPRNMNSDNRKVALDILGSSTMTKSLADPYALGGYSGFEIGVSLEQLDTSDMARLGTDVSGTGVPRQQKTANYWTITLGKGLYHNIDFFLQFAPLGQSDDFSSFGGSLRWGFYQLQSWPVYFAFQLGANSCNFQNLISTSTQTVDLITGYDLVNMSLYGGVGMVRAAGQFIGGTGGVTSDHETHTEATSGNHYFAGLSYRFGNVFTAAEYDYVSTNVLSAKIGVRY